MRFIIEPTQSMRLANLVVHACSMNHVSFIPSIIFLMSISPYNFLCLARARTRSRSLSLSSAPPHTKPDFARTLSFLSFSPALLFSLFLAVSHSCPWFHRRQCSWNAAARDVGAVACKIGQVLNTFIYKYMYSRYRKNPYMCIYVCIYKYTCICIYIYTHIYICTHIYIYIYVYTYIYIY